MNPIICQINAIAELAVSDFGVNGLRPSEMLSIRQALADALARVDAQLRWHREALADTTEFPGRHSEETA